MSLKRFETYFASQKGRGPETYAVPDLFTRGLDIDAAFTREGDALVNPYEYFHALFKIAREKGVQSGASLSRAKTIEKGGDWLKESVIYSSLVRTSSAFDSDRSGFVERKNRDGHKETGSFIKMIALLPHLEAMGIDALYLLPIMKHSTTYTKGDAGSPYSVIDFFSLDPALKETLTGDAFTLEEEFQAFIDAAHAFGIRVIIDIIPRTNGIDSTFIREHPEWFYWIRADEKKNYAPPAVEGIEQTAAPTKARLRKVYASEEVKQHIDRFEHDPRTQDPELFERIKDEENPLEAIEKHYNLTIAPAFSDHINDIQPAWTDVTFFRLYLDHPEASLSYIGEDTPPYILFDTIKSNLFPGKKPNEALWKTLENVIPHFQSFGVDGARIDMGHALPESLLSRIIERAREKDPDFGLIAEELEPKNAKASKQKGYNIIVGNGFFMQPRIWDGKSKRFFKNAKDLALPAFAAAETHDTPRLAAREGGETLSKCLTVLNHFLPGGVPFINAGLEIFESQAMNLGLDAYDIERKRLAMDDPYYGKLALFDDYPLHYRYQRRHIMPAILKTLTPLRKKYLKAIAQGRARFFSTHGTSVAFTLNRRKRALAVFGNLNPFEDTAQIIARTPLEETLKTKALKGRLLFSTHEPPRPFTQFVEGGLDIHLGPGEVKIVEFEADDAD